MKSMLIIASLVAVAVAGSTHHNFLSHIMPGHAPGAEETPIAAESVNIEKLFLVNTVLMQPEVKENVFIDIPVPSNSAKRIVIGQLITLDATTITMTGTHATMSGSINVRGGAFKMGSEPESIDTPESVDGTPIFSEVVAPIVVGTLN